MDAMTRILAMAMLLGSMAAAPAWAADVAAPAQDAPAEPAASRPAGPTPALRLCAPERTTIDYRACVNASTRDRNAKIRLA